MRVIKMLGYLKRFFICLGLVFSFAILPFDVGIRYIITGKDCWDKTMAVRLIKYITKDN